MGKLLVLALNEQEEKIIDKIIEAVSDYISLEAVQTFPASDISFSGLEIRQHQRRVLRNGKDIKLTRLEYGTLVFLASSPNRVFTQSQIFENVWNIPVFCFFFSLLRWLYCLFHTLLYGFGFGNFLFQLSHMIAERDFSHILPP